MGATSSTLARSAGSGLLPESYLSELGDGLTYERSLGTSRFFKTIKARHRDGQLVIKVFVKPDSSLDLRSRVRKIKGPLSSSAC